MRVQLCRIRLVNNGHEMITICRSVILSLFIKSRCLSERSLDNEYNPESVKQFAQRNTIFSTSAQFFASDASESSLMAELLFDASLTCSSFTGLPFKAVNTFEKLL